MIEDRDALVVAAVAIFAMAIVALGTFVRRMWSSRLPRRLERGAVRVPSRTRHGNGNDNDGSAKRAIDDSALGRSRLTAGNNTMIACGPPGVSVLSVGSPPASPDNSYVSHL
jgi:hypothetical protein